MTPERSDRGSGVLSTSLGLAFFLAFLLAAVQLLLALQATSVVEAVADDAVARAARSVPRATVEAEARATLGGLGERARFTWRVEGRLLELELRTPAPWPAPVGRALQADELVQVAQARLEGPA